MTDKKLKRNVISLETKIEILDRLAKGEGSTSVGKSFKLNEATIRTIKKKEKAIRNAVSGGTKYSANSSSYTRDAAIEKMEKGLFTFIEDHSQKRIPLDGITIKEKALSIYGKLKQMEPSTSSQLDQDKKKKFTASNGWLQGFLQRHAIRNIKIKGETASADTAAASEYPSTLAKIIEDGEYASDQVFNADETGLFWKKMPSRTFVARTEKSASGFKVAKDRITFLLCSNASGNRILKPLIVNRSLRPRALKGVNVKELPVHWMANKKAWVTASIFNEWFERCFIPEVKQYLKDKGMPFKVLLLIDNAPGHKLFSEHPNVKVVFLPPNTTSLLQPLDQGIIATFKAYYVRRSFKYILSKMDEDESLSVVDVWKKFSILDCIKHAVLSVSEIRASTLNACWKHVWPDCVKIVDTAAANVTGEVFTEIISLAQAVGGEGFCNLTIEDINEVIADRVLNEEELLEIAQETVNVNDSSDEDEPVTLSASIILEGLQLANKLESHFLLNDPMTERSTKFKSELNSCMGRYKEIYKELSKTGTQRNITEFTVKISQPTRTSKIQNFLDLPERELPQNTNDTIHCISDDDSNFTQNQHKRMRILSENESD